MKNKMMSLAGRVLSLSLLVSAGSALAQEGRPLHFSGLINDYTPANVKGGPYEMHGQWSMDVREWGAAEFVADMTMSDYGVTSTGAVDPTQGGQGPHTHHIKLTSMRVIRDMIGCPVVSPATTDGFQITGTVTLLTGNGGKAPFETVPPSSTLQVCVTGGTYVPYSNVSLVFGGPAVMHFGPQAIHGVVRSAPLLKDEEIH